MFHHTHPERDAGRDAEQAFDRLNPEFGVPADQHNPDGRHQPTRTHWGPERTGPER